jgi:hypothetical protein
MRPTRNRLSAWQTHAGRTSSTREHFFCWGVVHLRLRHGRWRPVKIVACDPTRCSTGYQRWANGYPLNQRCATWLSAAGGSRGNAWNAHAHKLRCSTRPSNPNVDGSRANTWQAKTLELTLLGPTWLASTVGSHGDMWKQQPTWDD